MRRGLPWLVLLSSACNRPWPDTGWERTCPAPYEILEVATGESVRIDWSERVEALEAEGQDLPEVDRVILGRLPFGRNNLIERWCRGREPDFEWTETIEVAPGTLSIELSPEEVGGRGTTTVVALRGLDQEVGTVAVSAARWGEQTEITFPFW